MKRRVVITGLGAVTPIGETLSEYWSGLLSGKNGVGLITRFDTSLHDVKIAAEVKNFDPIKYIDSKSIRRMDRFTHFSISAAVQAVEDSEINFELLDRNRCGVIMGSGIGGLNTFEDQTEKFILGNKNPRVLSPFFITMMISDIAPGYVSIRYGLKGPNYATTSACATSSHAIADAFMHIQRGSADVMVAGGSEAAITSEGIGGFSVMRALSNRNDSPETASRPFDKERNGFVMGEGGGAVILEEYEHAKKRGAKIYAELAGIGLTADAFHITAPDTNGDGARRSMLESIRDAGLKIEDIDYINAHGTSTELNDATETKAIKAVFGEHTDNLIVSSIKSMTGHLLGAAGAIEAIATALTVKHNIIPPTMNLQNPDPDCDLNYSPNSVTKKTVHNAISNTFGFGGHNASLLLRKVE